MRALLPLAMALSGFGAARAADLELTLKTPNGQPVADAVAVYRPAHALSGSFRFPWPSVMAQHNIGFDPHVLIVPVGADVTFPNQDKVRHHVYSFSAAKRFELKLYGREEARTVRFDKPGVVAVGCNIHDRMSGFIVVADTPFAAKSDAAGALKLTGLPTGPGTLSIWQANLKAPGNTLNRPLGVVGDSRQAIALDLRPSASMTMHH